MRVRYTILFLLCTLPSCAFGDRVVLMKEFERSLPTGTADFLKGKSVHVALFEDADLDPDQKWEGTEPSDPTDFEYVEMSDAAEDKWDAEVVARKKEALAVNEDLEQLPIVGGMRNGFGMRTAWVRTVVPPGEWMKQVLELELASQGASIVGKGAADISISGVIRRRFVDIYMVNWADLVVDFEVQQAGRPQRKFTLHTTGKQTAWTSSSYEFYRCFRRCQQKMIRLLLTELAKG